MDMSFLIRVDNFFLFCQSPAYTTANRPTGTVFFRYPDRTRAEWPSPVRMVSKVFQITKEFGPFRVFHSLDFLQSCLFSDLEIQAIRLRHWSFKLLERNGDRIHTSDGTKRYFSCHYCEHQLRFGSAYCGSCYQPTPLYNRRWIWILGALSATVGVLVLALLTHV